LTVLQDTDWLGGTKPSSCDGDDMTDSTLTELHHRSADGIEVSLLWSRGTNTLTVAVEDSRSGESFELPAPAEKALDVFEHPFAYAAA
jgi:hypothetical protein